MKDGKAEITEIRKFFEMTVQDMKNEWTKLSDEEKEYFRVEVGKVISE